MCIIVRIYVLGGNDKRKTDAKSTRTSVTGGCVPPNMGEGTDNRRRKHLKPLKPLSITFQTHTFWVLIKLINVFSKFTLFFSPK